MLALMFQANILEVQTTYKRWFQSIVSVIFKHHRCQFQVLWRVVILQLALNMQPLLSMMGRNREQFNAFMVTGFSVLEQWTNFQSRSTLPISMCDFATQVLCIIEFARVVGWICVHKRRIYNALSFSSACIFPANSPCTKLWLYFYGGMLCHRYNSVSTRQMIKQMSTSKESRPQHLRLVTIGGTFVGALRYKSERSFILTTQSTIDKGTK